MSVVYVYGTFTLSLPRDYTITVGGRPGYVSVVNSIGYITAVVPGDAPLGTQPLVVSFQGEPSTPFNISLSPYAPEFQTTAFVPATDDGPRFPLAAYFPFAHSNLTPVHAGAPAAPGERVVSILTGVGLTSPPIKLGGLNQFTNLSIPPVLIIGGTTTPLLRAGSSGSMVEVDFNAPAKTPGVYPVLLTVAAVPANAVNLAIADKPTLNAVLSGASFRSPGTAAPGSIVSLFGLGFGPQDKLYSFPSTSVNGTAVMFGPTAAPIFDLAAVEGQINVLVPYDLPVSGTVDLTVTAPMGNTSVFKLNLAPWVPAMFFYTDPRNSNRRNAVALLPNSVWVAMPPAMGRAMGLPDCEAVSKASACAQAAHIGDVIQVFATGLGRATPNGDPNGKPLSGTNVAPATGNPLYRTVDEPIVTIGGVPAKVQFSGLAPGFSGLYQVNVQIPPGIQTGDDVPISIQIGASITDTATIAVAP
jgi:uncharacterized protein (TIGR03437 family)